MTAMILESITGRSPWTVGKWIIEVVGSQPSSCMLRMMLTPAWNGKAAGDSDLRWEAVSPQMAFFYCPGWGKSKLLGGNTRLGGPWVGRCPRQRIRSPIGVRTGLSGGGMFTWCNHSTWGRSISPIGPGQWCGGPWGWRRSLPHPQWIERFPRGWIFPALLGDPQSCRSWTAWWGACQYRCELVSWRVFWDTAGHPGGGLLQLPPMPKKLILSKIGSSGACSTGSSISDGRIIWGARCEIWMALGEQDWPTGWHRRRPTSYSASTVLHPE